MCTKSNTVKVERNMKSGEKVSKNYRNDFEMLVEISVEIMFLWFWGGQVNLWPNLIKSG